MSMDTALFSDHTSTSSTTHSAHQLLGVVPGKVEPVLLHLDLEHHRQPTRMRCVGHVAGAARRLESGHCDRQSDFLMFEFQLRVTRQNLRALRALPTLQKPTIDCSPRAIRRSNVASAQTRTWESPSFISLQIRSTLRRRGW